LHIGSHQLTFVGVLCCSEKENQLAHLSGQFHQATPSTISNLFKSVHTSEDLSLRRDESPAEPKEGHSLVEPKMIFLPLS
jgi:hypothetical protein